MKKMINLINNKKVKQLNSLSGHPCRNMENSGTEGDLNCWGPAQEVSEEKDISKYPRDHSCYILAKNVAIFALIRKICLTLN